MKSSERKLITKILGRCYRETMLKLQKRIKNGGKTADIIQEARDKYKLEYAYGNHLMKRVTSPHAINPNPIEIPDREDITTYILQWIANEEELDDIAKQLEQSIGITVDAAMVYRYIHKKEIEKCLSYIRGGMEIQSALDKIYREDNVLLYDHDDLYFYIKFNFRNVRDEEARQILAQHTVKYSEDALIVIEIWAKTSVCLPIKVCKKEVNDKILTNKINQMKAAGFTDKHIIEAIYAEYNIKISQNKISELRKKYNIPKLK